MTVQKLDRFWLIATGALILIIIVSGCLIWVRHDNGQPLAVSNPTTPPMSGEVSIDGAVADPGSYPLKAGDSLDSVLQSSGGLNSDADLSHIRIYVPSAETTTLSQKIDINHAEAWLLEALPDIGEVRAQVIIDYRQQKGLFNNIEDLTKVPGISSALFEKIKPYITIGD